MNPKTFRILLPLILATALLPACHHTKPEAQKRYPFTGRVLSIDTQEKTAVIDGDNIPGFMEAMAMSYKIKPADQLTQLKTGDIISAEVVVIDSGKTEGPSDDWLENVKVTGHAKPAAPAKPTTQRIPAPGDQVPDFAFTNQNGKRITLHQYRGKVLLVTFIYTRCPFPDFCPRMSANFDEVYKQFGANPSFAGTRLLSVSFDPEHDTPKVLRDYAYSVAHTHDAALFSKWQFASASRADLPNVATFFGLIATPEGGMITHNLSTTVIGPDGKIVRWYHGSDWQPSDLIKDATEATPTKHKVNENGLRGDGRIRPASERSQPFSRSSS
ncbi:MAG: SCO family protein [Candidatus Sulfotelmatobacter sp.]